MATIEIVDDGISVSDFGVVQAFLAGMGIEIGKHDLGAEARAAAAVDTLGDEQRAALIASYPEARARYSKLPAYRADVVCFWPEFEHLDFIMSKFAPIHYHFENEYWYFVDGRARFGFLGPNGCRVVATVGAGEHLQVPEGIWQWFDLTPERRMKAIRFFNSTGKVPARKPVTHAALAALTGARVRGEVDADS